MHATTSTPSTDPTGRFTILEPQEENIDEFYVALCLASLNISQFESLKICQTAILNDIQIDKLGMF